MRLWHQYLIPFIPDKQLLGQHRECCALRGRGYTRKQSTVLYAQEKPLELLVAYHIVVMDEMLRRGFHVTDSWWEIDYRGQYMKRSLKVDIDVVTLYYNKKTPIYDYHDRSYLMECIENLESKGNDMAFVRRFIK